MTTHVRGSTARGGARNKSYRLLLEHKIWATSPTGKAPFGDVPVDLRKCRVKLPSNYLALLKTKNLKAYKICELCRGRKCRVGCKNRAKGTSVSFPSTVTTHNTTTS